MADRSTGNAGSRKVLDFSNVTIRKSRTPLKEMADRSTGNTGSMNETDCSNVTTRTGTTSPFRDGMLTRAQKRRRWALSPIHEMPSPSGSVGDQIEEMPRPLIVVEKQSASNERDITGPAPKLRKRGEPATTAQPAPGVASRKGEMKMEARAVKPSGQTAQVARPTEFKAPKKILRNRAMLPEPKSGRGRTQKHQ